jgi:hypothetical protein
MVVLMGSSHDAERASPTGMVYVAAAASVSIVRSARLTA